MRKHLAKETYTADQAFKKNDGKRKWINTILLRIKPLVNSSKQFKVLDLGCAQGETLIALCDVGYDAYGVEPYRPAIDEAHKLGQKLGYTFTIRYGRAEEIPYDTGLFDIVLAISVMEHVEDLELSLNEIYRVLKPGGVFWFNSASSMSPLQNEIALFPFFGWYPNKLKIYIMNWAKNNKPELVGGTQHPAIHWWTPWKARKKLNHAGFIKVWDRWDMVNISDYKGIQRIGILLAKKYKLFRIFADIIVPGCSYAARK